MVSLLTVFLALTVVYIALLLFVARRGSDRFQPVGPLLMVRTQAGKRLIDKMSRNRAWGAVADVFIVLTVLAGVVMLGLVVYQNTLLFTHTDIVRERPPRVEETLAIPGINPVIPVGYGLFGLLVALVIHEGGHGVLARFAKLPVKSLGLLFLVIPVGAFVEPDEVALQRTSLRNKLRLFAAGPGPNLVLAAFCVLAFAQLMAPAVGPAHEGVAILGVSDGLPAALAGVEAGMFVTAIDGEPIDTLGAFQERLNTTGCCQTLELSYWHDGATGSLKVSPIDKYEYYEEAAPSINEESFRGQPFLGVSPAGPDELDDIFVTLQHPFRELGVAQGSLFYIAMPFLNLQPFPGTFHDIYAAGGAFDGWGGSFWIVMNSLYWLFWINVVLGTFNALPLGPLDGGHMFRHTTHWFLRRRKGIATKDLDVVDEEGIQPHYVARDPEVQARLDRVDGQVGLVNKVLGWSLLVLILAPLIVPQFL